MTMRDKIDALNEAARPVYDAGYAQGFREATEAIQHQMAKESAVGLYDLSVRLLTLASAIDDAEIADRLGTLAAAALGRTPHKDAALVLTVLRRRGTRFDQGIIKDARVAAQAVLDGMGGYR